MPSSFDDPPGMLPEEQSLPAARRDAPVRAEAENVFLKPLLESLPYPVSYIDADLIYRQCNAAAAMTVGRTPDEIVGQSVAAVVGEDSEVIDLLRRVLTSGEPYSGTVEFTAAGSSSAAFYQVSYLPDIDAEGEVVGVLTNVVDVTDLVRGERALRESEERSAFLLLLADALRPLADPVAVQETASRLLGEHLAADRAGYFEIDGSDCVIERDWSPSVPHLSGRFPVAAFGEGLMSAYQSGRMVVMNDIAEEPLTPEEREAYAGIGVAAQISIPLIKDGEFAGGMTVHSSAPRAWTPQEMRLLEETAERTWAALGRAKSGSELRRAEQSLRESDQHLRLATSAAGIGAFDWDIRTGVNRWSEELETMYGLAPGEFGRTQPAWEQLVHPDDRATAVALVKGALETGQPVEGEWRVVWPDGSVHWLSGRFQAYKDDRGRPLRLAGVNIDVTERKATEDALRESRRQSESLGNLLARAEQPFGMGYADGSLGYVNAAFERLTGYSQEELRALDWSTTLTPPEWREAEYEQLEELNRTGQPVRYEKEYVRKDGARVPIELLVHLSRDADGRLEHYYSFITDLTERKQAEEALRASEERYRAIVELADEDLAASSDETYSSPESVAATHEQRRQFRTRFIALAATGRRQRLRALLVAIAFELAFLIPMGLMSSSRYVLGLPGSLLMLIVVITAALAGWQVGLAAAIAGGVIFWGTVADFGVQSAPVTAALSMGIWVAAALISGLLADGLRDQTRKRKSAAVALARAETLREHEAEHAAQDERTRIARDLHDSVTQSLFAATLKAEALPECGDPAQLESITDDVRRLSRGALAQMRTLLLELRGDPVEEVPLQQLLRNLVEATESRASVKVALTLSEGCALPPKVHEAVYRITQEALNNVVRHAKAANAWVQIDVDPAHARLLVGDDGRGFDPAASVDPSHVGLKSMRERTDDSGGQLFLRSAPGEGTTMTVDWPLGDGPR